MPFNYKILKPKSVPFHLWNVGRRMEKKVWNTAEERPKEMKKHKCKGSRALVTDPDALTSDLSVVDPTGVIRRWEPRRKMSAAHAGDGNPRVPLHHRHKALLRAEVQGRGSEPDSPQKERLSCFSLFGYSHGWCFRGKTWPAYVWMSALREDTSKDVNIYMAWTLRVVILALDWPLCGDKVVKQCGWAYTHFVARWVKNWGLQLPRL